MKTSNHNTSRCWLIQLASVIFLSTLMLTPAYAKREQEPQSSQKQPKAPSSKPKKKKAPVTSTGQEEQPAAAEAEAEAKAQKQKAEAEAKAQKEKAEAEAEAKAQKEKAEAEAEAKAQKEKAEAEAEAKAKAQKQKAEAEAEAEAKAKAKAQKQKAEAEAKAKAQKQKAEAEAKAQKQKAEAEAEAKAKAEKEKAEAQAKAPPTQDEEAAKAKAREEAAKTPPLSLRVDEENLKGTHQILHVTVTNNSMRKGLDGLDGCTLSVISDPPIQVSYQNTVGNKVLIHWPTKVPPLRSVVNVTKLGEPAASQTFPLFLAPPHGCRDAKIVLCVLDKNGKDVANRVSVEWHADGKWSVKRLFRSRPSSFASGFNTLYSILAFYHLCKVCDITPSTFVALLRLLDFSKPQLPPALTKQEILDRLEKMGFSPTSKGIQDVAGVFAIQLERARAAAKGPKIPVRPKRNLLLLGPTGAGKTFLLKRTCEVTGLPCRIVRANDFTAAGYQGRNVHEVFQELIEEALHSLEAAGRGVVIFDELDKIFAALNKSQKDIGGHAVQSQLLPYFDTPSQSKDYPKVPIPGFWKPLDTANILFIGTGAFSGIEIDLNENTSESELRAALVRYGMLGELLSRCRIARLPALKVQDFYRILNSEQSIDKDYIEALDYQTGMKWVYSNKAKWFIAKEAVEALINARGLYDVVEKYDSALRDCLELDKNTQSEILKAKPQGTTITITQKLLRALDRSQMDEAKRILLTTDTDAGEEDPNPPAEAAGAAAESRSDERPQHASGASSQQATNLANLLAAAAKGYIPRGKFPYLLQAIGLKQSSGHVASGQQEQEEVEDQSEGSGQQEQEEVEDQSEGRSQTLTALNLAAAPIQSAPTTHQVPLGLLHQGIGT